MRILILCEHGKNRSRYLAAYFQEKGYAEVEFVGIRTADQSEIQRKIDYSDIVVVVHGSVADIVRQEFEISGKRLIELKVEDRPELALPERKTLDGEEWIRFQEEHVYPKLREQMKRHLPL